MIKVLIKILNLNLNFEFPFISLIYCTVLINYSSINLFLFFKDNVVPASATAIINHRIHPSQTVSEVIEFDKNVVNDQRVQFKVKGSREAHPISPFGPEDLPFQMIATSIMQTFQDTVVVPGIL
jgi:acetylornithine deacetylase/succinyl-diaminopimelate desuccinylase-like protein